jgi:hypothetical protein
VDILRYKLQLRLDIYFGLTNKAQRAFNAAHSWHFVEYLSIQELKRYTKSKALHNKLVELKRLSIRAVDAA